MPSWFDGAALAGGLIIGLSSILLLYLTGRIAGISGILAGVLSGDDRPWQIMFIMGMIVGSALPVLIFNHDEGFEFMASPVTTVIAGLLVGIGTRLGSGCTSGHGICGISRLSQRSIIATCTFIITAILTVYLVRHVFA